MELAVREDTTVGLTPDRTAEQGDGPEASSENSAAPIHNRRSAVSLFDETGLAPRDLELELRETVLLQDAQFASSVLGSLQDLDVQLALDDLGTGYSSLSNLKQFPIDILKIDQSFVRELTTDSSANSIVSAVIGTGKNLGNGNLRRAERLI
jgi:EAL domain-containing protein (putative c-di-GMP-specific phosphodiesterase class I)